MGGSSGVAAYAHHVKATTQATKLNDEVVTLQSSEQAAGADVTTRQDPYGDVSTKVTPVSAPEAASWSVVIAASYAVTAVLIYVVVSQLFMPTPEAAAFDAALARVREDFRVTVRLGDRIKGETWLHDNLLVSTFLCHIVCKSVAFL